MAADGKILFKWKHINHLHSVTPCPYLDLNSREKLELDPGFHGDFQSSNAQGRTDKESHNSKGQLSTYLILLSFSSWVTQKDQNIP